MLEERIAAVRADRQRGSAALADEALAILAEAAPQQARTVARALARARPGMVALENRIAEVMAAEGLEDLPRRCEEARARAAQDREAAARCAAERLTGREVLTVSWSDTALRALELAGPRGVVLPLGRPLLDGQRAAQRLALAGMEVEVVPDAALGRAALDCDEAVVGADAILAGGTVVNRAGTLLAALAMGLGARRFWVVAETAKVTWRGAVPLEEDPPEDVWRPSPLLPVKVRHPLFDATPAALVHGYCTELGALTAKQLETIAARHARNASVLE